MRILVLIVLAVIAYLLYKKFTSNNESKNPALDNPSSAAGNLSQADSEQQDNSTAKVAAGAAAAGAAAIGAAVNGVAAGSANLTNATNAVLPNTGNQVTDIQEMFKILNLRPSDAPRLSITADQYNSLKSGQTTDLPAAVLDNVMGKLTAML